MDKKEIEFVKTLLDKLVNRIDELEEENNELKEKLVTTSDIIPYVSGSLAMWTEIHIQPLDIDDIENSKVYWIKHPQKKWSVYDKDLVTAIKKFVERWGNDL